MTDLSKMSLSQLANTFNDAANELGKETIITFRDRKSGERRTMEILAELTRKGNGKATKKSGNGRGRPAIFAGKKLNPMVVENPRADGSHGNRSFAIVARSPGITYEDYIKKGGRNNDLRWDIAHKYVEAVA
jgi:hypothetical protein